MDATALPETLKITQELPREIVTAIAKHDLRNLRNLERVGYGATTEGTALTKRNLTKLADAVRAALETKAETRGNPQEAKMLKVVRGLDRDVIALAVLHSALHSLGKQETQLETTLAVGAALAGECWAAGLIQSDAARAKSIARRVKQRHSSASVRLMAAKKEAAQSYKRRDGTQVNAYEQREWPSVQRTCAGTWGLNLLTTALSDMFRWREETEPGPKGTLVATRYLELTEEAEAFVDAALTHSRTSRPVWFASKELPKAWDAFNGCGSPDPRVSGATSFLRTRYKATAAAGRAAVKSGQLQPALDGVNTLQSVAWTLNTEMFDLITECYNRGIAVKGLPSIHPVKPLPRCPDEEWAQMDAGQRKLRKMRKDELRLLANEAKCNRRMFETDMTEARELAVVAKFYTPMNCDWRGRIYSLSHFNFQREDRVRALFLFAQGEPIGVDGLRWLKMHVANCGALNKIDKRPIAERVQWCDDNILLLEDIARRPLLNTEWTKADKPFLFLAACKELCRAISQGPSYECSLPVSFDGSCSGLQHLSAMTRASEGSLVNLTPNELPQDIYATVAELVNKRLVVALTTEPENSCDDKEVLAAARQRELAQLFLDYKIGRGDCKRGVMTYAYSSKKFGMACQLQTDLMKPLAREVLEGKRAVHPFAPWEQGSEERPSAAARFLADHIFEAIEQIVHKPSEAMKYLQKLAKALAHEGKPLRWTTPVGIPWINRYHDPVTKRVELWLNDGGVSVRSQLTVAVDDKPEINKDKASNGVAPNFVHALDAAHLLLVANAARNRGIISIATVHDSFGCLPSRATEFNAIIREQFAEMYETHDVLAEILAQARLDLTDDNCDRLPDAISPGPLNLKDILNAPFAFA
ncbi:hypothetical protein HU230_0012675 [Bradyrhizobium quebecense]|uniref:DNA-directed RNA polymerase n=1 Tax=Bradyrhizobium quebecense TaxID=2748629 RepID=A0A974AGR2_9BRAD|nr:DNA-directed RNA polymerase [Bradyrhizobium quebecense]UGA46844.1 hypothetical protein HU230_0012675 [Bradyrhizobium quebecense]